MVTDKTFYVGDCNYPGYYATFSSEIAAHDYSDFIDENGACSYVISNKPVSAEGEEFIFEDHDGWVRPY